VLRPMRRGSGNRFGPELTRTFEAALILPTSRLDGSAANRPSTICLVVHSVGLSGKVTLFFSRRFASLASRHFQSSNFLEDALLLAMAQLMESLLHPRLGLGVILSANRSA